MHEIQGSCHCGNIQLEIGLSQPPESYDRRACDCDFCVKHGASYISDSAGSLNIFVKDFKQLSKYRQGSESADFLCCANCHALVGVIYQEADVTYGAVNSCSINKVNFGSTKTVSPKKLVASDKISRWKDVWFRNVNVLQRAHGKI